MYHSPIGNATSSAIMAIATCTIKLTLNCVFISSTFPFPIATAIKRLEVDNIIVLNIPINEMIPPNTAYNPKSTTPKACKAKRVVNIAQMVFIIILPYIIIEL